MHKNNAIDTPTRSAKARTIACERARLRASRSAGLAGCPPSSSLSGRRIMKNKADPKLAMMPKNASATNHFMVNNPT